MDDRRAFILSAAGAAMAPALARAEDRSKRPRNLAVDGAPPDIIEGRPPKMDFGGGLQVPLDKNAFATLWEGSDRWMTFGLGTGRTYGMAMKRADAAAELTMQLMLLTLVFDRKRLVKAAGNGWRSKTGELRDLVLGEVPLPGGPVRPFGSRFQDGSPLFVPGLGPTTMPQGGAAPGPSSLPDPTEYEGAFAVTGYAVKKADLSLEDVRAQARIAADEPAPRRGKGRG